MTNETFSFVYQFHFLLFCRSIHDSENFPKLKSIDSSQIGFYWKLIWAITLSNLYTRTWCFYSEWEYLFYFSYHVLKFDKLALDIIKLCQCQMLYLISGYFRDFEITCSQATIEVQNWRNFWVYCCPKCWTDKHLS